MKDWRRVLLYLFLLALPLGVIGCADDKEPGGDTPINPDDAPTYYDPWLFGDNMDITVHPGDNFYNYCNGSWLKLSSNMDGDGFVDDISNLSHNNVIRLDIPEVRTITEHAEQIAQTLDLAREQISADMDLIHEKFDDLQSVENIIRAVAEFAKLGYTDAIFNFSLLPQDGRFKLLITPINSGNEEGEGEGEGEEEQGSIQALRLMGYSEEQALIISRDSRALKAQLPPTSNREYTIYNLSRHPEWGESIRSAADMTRSAGSALLSALIQELNLTQDQVYYDESLIPIFDELSKSDPKELKNLLIESIANKFAFAVDANALESSLENSLPGLLPNCSTYQKMLFFLSKSLMTHQISKAYIESYVTADLKQITNDRCEEIRRSFDKRLDKIDWISDATRAKAKEKLAAIGIEPLYPDQWIEFNYSCNGPTFLHDVLSLGRAKLEGVLSMIGEPSKGHLLNASLFDNIAIFEFNAFYSQYFNSVTILPAIMCELAYGHDKPEAYNYATLSIIGHEFTHGFDSSGSEYDAQGNKNNWWTSADRTEYQARLEKLVACYNELEVAPGYFNDGMQTLNENIADLGGLLIARDALFELLIDRGATEEELRREARHLFQAFANLWRSYYSNETIVGRYENDEHSAGKERVNGVLRNIDSWYELYEVDENKELYLSPDKRTYIW